MNEVRPDRAPTPGEVVTIEFDGQSLDALEGQSVAAALLTAGIRTLRRSRVLGQPRGIFCGIGNCFDCIVSVEGRGTVRACLTPVHAGMRISSRVLIGDDGDVRP